MPTTSAIASVTLELFCATNYFRVHFGMGLNKDILPPNILGLMTDEARHKYAPGQLLPAESQAKGDGKLEKHLHDEFINFCHLKEIDFCHARPDKKSTIAVGRLDFLCWRARLICFVEFKASWGRLSEEQKQFLARQQARGTPCLVTRDLAEAIGFTTKHLLPPWTDRLNAIMADSSSSSMILPPEADLTESSGPLTKAMDSTGS
jgi:hypothetical protein